MNRIILLTSIAAFVILLFYALSRELERNEKELGSGISGVIDLAPGQGEGIVKTDNAYLFLFDPVTLKIAATHVMTPFVPPVTFYIGQSNASKGLQLEGSYYLFIVTDKDGNPHSAAPGEWVGTLSEPILIGSEEVHYVLDRPFIEFPPELIVFQDSPSQQISGIVSASPELESSIESTDQMIILLFDLQQARPVAFNILPHFQLPQAFSIGQSHAIGKQNLSGAYSLRIVTDKNNNPFQPAPGELIGRSKEQIPLGTQNIQFVLDEHYVR